MQTFSGRTVQTLAALAGTTLLVACGSTTPTWTMGNGGSPRVAAPMLDTAPALQASDFGAPMTPVAAATPTTENHAPTASRPETSATFVAASSGPVLEVNDASLITGVSRVTFAEEGADFDPCVSRDGSMLVFASTQHRSTSDIYVKRTDSRVVTQLTSDNAQDAMPVISPDGSKIAFASDRAGNWDIFVMPITGGRAVQVTSDLADDVHPSWSPDGRQLVFSRRGQMTGRWEMWTADIANPAVASFIGYGLLPQWCPVGAMGQEGSERILFQLGRDRGSRTFSLWTVDVAQGSASNLTEIASSTNTALIAPAWSPDGQWVAYTEVPINPQASTESRPAWAAIWMISSGGDSRVRLTDSSSLSLSPVWAGNNRLFFVSNRSGTDNIWSLDVSPAIQSARAVQPAGNSAVAHKPTPAAHKAVSNPETHAAPAHETEHLATVPEVESDHH